MQYRINSPQVIYETFDDEVVIVNFDDGNYYSLNRTGGAVWEAIRAGMSAQDIVSGLSSVYGSDPSVAPATAALIEHLLRERLIAAADAAAAAAPIAFKAEGAFEPPTLSRYTDMQELLLVDPIHEVDETLGWPAPKPPAP